MSTATPRELHALRPDRMRVCPAPTGGRRHTSTASVRHGAVRARGEGVAADPASQLFHPLDDHYGMSPLEAAATALDIHNAAGAWNKALLDNAARPSGALVYDGRTAPLTDAQFDRLKAELDGEFPGRANAGRPLLLEGGLDWKPMSLSPKDMDFVEAKAAAAREIALAFGVPPMLLGLPGDNTYANYPEANRAFYRQTIVPLMRRTCRRSRTGSSRIRGQPALGAGPGCHRGARQRAGGPVAPYLRRGIPHDRREA